MNVNVNVNETAPTGGSEPTGGPAEAWYRCEEPPIPTGGLGPGEAKHTAIAATPGLWIGIRRGSARRASALLGEFLELGSLSL